MIMSSIKKRPVCPFSLLSFAIFVSPITLILSSRVLVTRLPALDITAESLEKIKRLSTDNRSNQTPWLLEKALVYQIRPKNLITTYSIRQEDCLLCCFLLSWLFFVFKLILFIRTTACASPISQAIFYNITPTQEDIKKSA